MSFLLLTSEKLHTLIRCVLFITNLRQLDISLKKHLINFIVWHFKIHARKKIHLCLISPYRLCWLRLFILALINCCWYNNGQSNFTSVMHTSFYLSFYFWLIQGSECYCRWYSPFSFLFFKLFITIEKKI